MLNAFNMNIEHTYERTKVCTRTLDKNMGM